MFFLITEIAALAGRVLYIPVLDHPGYILGAGADTRVFLGALSEVILAIAVIGTAVTLYPSSTGKTKASPWAMSAAVFWKPPSSSPASSAFCRS